MNFRSPRLQFALCLIIGAIASPHPGFASESLSNKLSAWKQSHEEVLQSWDDLNKQVDELVAFFSLVNAPGRKENYADLIERFPVIVLLKAYPVANEGDWFVKDDNWITDRNEIVRQIKQIRTLVEKRSPDFCVTVSTSDSGWKLKSECMGYPDYAAWLGFTSIGDGILSGTIINPDLTLHTFRYATTQEAIDAIRGGELNPVWLNTLNAAFAVSTLGEEFQARRFVATRDAKYPDWATDPDILPATPELFQQQCIDQMPSAIVKSRLTDLLAEHRYAAPISNWNSNLLKRTDKCQKYAQYLCSDTYTIKGTRILSYFNVNCDKRDVTAADIRDDMAHFSTEADRLKHSELLETILACDAAQGAGYQFFHKEPATPEECADGKANKNGGSPDKP